jgi:hypothetical protein
MGQRCRLRSLPRRIRHCATIPLCTSQDSNNELRTLLASNASLWLGEETNGHHGVHLLRHFCRETSAVRPSSLTGSNVPLRPRSVSSRHKSNSEAGGTAFRVARHAEGLSHLDTGLPGLPALQSHPSHSCSNGRLDAAGSAFPSRPYRPRGAPSNVSRLRILPHCSWPLHALAWSHPHPGYHNRHHGTLLIDRLDIPLWLSADHHHRPGTSGWVATLWLPGQIVWNSTFPDNRPPSRSQRTRGTLPPDTEGSRHVPRRPAVERGAPSGSPRHAHIIQSRSASVSSWASVWRAAENPRRAIDPYSEPSGLYLHCLFYIYFIHSLQLRVFYVSQNKQR